jgi:hypothetical protein
MLLQLQDVAPAGKSAQVAVKDQEQPVPAEVFQPVEPALGVRE